MTTFQSSLEFAQQLDQSDPLASFRNKFHLPNKDGKERVYFLGNSLGLQPKSTTYFIEKILHQWEEEGVESFFAKDEPWMNYHHKLVQPLSIIVGSLPHEISVMNQLTVNIHLMLVSFYRPEGRRNKILVESKAFPSDQYALKSYIRHLGLNPDDVLVEIPFDVNGTACSHEEIKKQIQNHKEELALIFLSGVQYYNGQLFDMQGIAKAAKEAGAMVGFDLAHAVGNVAMKLHEWNIDFACWCSYKYLNGGPGTIGGVFVHEKHHHSHLNRLEGWWGVKESERFLMKDDFISSLNATSWQLSTPPLLLFACLNASLEIFMEAGWDQLVAKQQKMSAWTDFLLNGMEHSFFSRITPIERGCQISLQFKKSGKEVYERIVEKGFMVDWREPDVIRFAPVPLYNSYVEIWQFIHCLKEVVNEVSLSN